MKATTKVPRLAGLACLALACTTPLRAADGVISAVTLTAIHAPDQSAATLERACLFVVANNVWYAKLKTDANDAEVRASIYMARALNSQVDILVKAGTTVCADNGSATGYPAIDSVTVY